jgi:hypothetical protein
MIVGHRLVGVASEARRVENLSLWPVDLHDRHLRLAYLMAGIELEAGASGADVRNKVAVGSPSRACDRCIIDKLHDLDFRE